MQSPPISPNSLFHNHYLVTAHSVYHSWPLDTSEINTSYDSCPFRIRVNGIPPTGTKSRVETQIKLSIQLVPIDKTIVPSVPWKYLRVPEYLLARPKLKKIAQKQKLMNAEDPSNILDLEARVICESNKHKKIKMCQGCVRRERKRAERKKNAILTSIHIQPGSAVVDAEYERDRQRILLFNCDHLLDFNLHDTILPTRITCYCRHHDERIGFRVWFGIKDCKGNMVAVGQTPLIMITDDHKMTKLNCSPRRRYRQRQIVECEPSSEDDASITSALSRICSGVMAQPYDTKNTLDTSDPWQTEKFTNQAVRLLDDTVRDYNSHDVMMLSANTVLEQSCAYLKHIVPSQGSLLGGTKVTLVGSGFCPDVGVVFGNSQAILLDVSSTSITCITPPGDHAGPVKIAFKNYPFVTTNNQVSMFNYFDDSEQALMNLSYKITQTPSSIQDMSHVLSQHSPVDLMEIDSTGHTLLHYAAHLNHNYLAKILITQCPQLIHVQDQNGLTALYFAIRSKSTHITQNLVQHGADTHLLSWYACRLGLQGSSTALKEDSI
ncbi:SPT3 Dosage dependent suppressor of Ty-induced promoter mutations-like protein [Rhizopus azygosporus]|uniref:SPT3 Dosage dependent suppressor of Ty-induced promoter mutations-like protein n=1 Tax=Rhizopus azygosporus TaxID=86630 RepID=A0A367JAU4_RHIAZ|nr:SPT3 Dosage dependent suppressor of Ty-induced promoter mutations-like protein [Rhizopus azygosporus]